MPWKGSWFGKQSKWKCWALNHHLITERDHVIYKILNRHLEAGILQAKIGGEGRHWAAAQIYGSCQDSAHGAAFNWLTSNITSSKWSINNINFSTTTTTGTITGVFLLAHCQIHKPDLTMAIPSFEFDVLNFYPSFEFDGLNFYLLLLMLSCFVNFSSVSQDLCGPQFSLV